LKVKHFRIIKRVIMILLIALILLLTLPIKVKHAIPEPEVNESISINIEDYIGSRVILLCKHAEWQVTEPPKFEFVTAAISVGGQFYKTTGITGLYVYPKCFIGGAVKYDFHHKNMFVLRGLLTKAPFRKNGTLNDYELRLDSWDIIYPIEHWVFSISTNSEFYKSNIFVFDYLFPDVTWN